MKWENLEDVERVADDGNEKRQRKDYFVLNVEVILALFGIDLLAGVKIDDPVLKVFNGQEVEVWSRVVWKPKWAVTFSDVKRKVKGNNNSVS
uniref:Uncharacterized protein n=1 Tax=Lactuca sativa TaxID=4236 RepID=A0A9R1V4C4_LACSA|nr:hypothetical protein LSAT_V11C600315350 [Lactuca sativa]